MCAIPTYKFCSIYTYFIRSTFALRCNTQALADCVKSWDPAMKARDYKRRNGTNFFQCGGYESLNNVSMAPDKIILKKKFRWYQRRYRKSFCQYMAFVHKCISTIQLFFSVSHSPLRIPAYHQAQTLTFPRAITVWNERNSKFFHAANGRHFEYILIVKHCTICRHYGAV